MYHWAFVLVLVLILVWYITGNREKLANLGTAHPNILSNPAPNPFGDDDRLGLNWQNRFLRM